MAFEISPVKEDISFTNDQQQAIDTIIDFIAKPFDESKYIIGLTGAGGTGKTFSINYIINHCKYSRSVIKCTSPTHKACRVFSNSINNILVDTIQSTFGLRLDLRLENFDPDNPKFSPIGSPKLDNIKLLIIDEASMLPIKLVNYVCTICKERKIKILFIGDDSQLSPVNEKQSTAFIKCFKVCKLNEIVRQAKGNPINKLLVMLRNDITNKTYTFLNYISKNINAYEYDDKGNGFTICNKSSFINLIDNSFSNEEYTKNIDMYRIIAYTNLCVAGWNNYIRNKIIKDANKNVITKNDLIMSYETIVDEFLSIILNNSEEYIIKDIVNYVDSKYKFKGFLIKFQKVHGGEITKPIFVIDSKDKYTVLLYYKTIEDLKNTAKKATGGTRASKWKEYYDFKKKYLLPTNIIDKQGKTLIERDIDYGFAITAHKSQGSTYETVFVDLNDMVYDKNGRPYVNQDDLLRRLYVSCSRASKNLILCYGN